MYANSTFFLIHDDNSKIKSTNVFMYEFRQSFPKWFPKDGKSTDQGKKLLVITGKYGILPFKDI